MIAFCVLAKAVSTTLNVDAWGGLCGAILQAADAMQRVRTSRRRTGRNCGGCLETRGARIDEPVGQ